MAEVKDKTWGQGPMGVTLYRHPGLDPGLGLSAFCDRRQDRIRSFYLHISRFAPKKSPAPCQARGDVTAMLTPVGQGPDTPSARAEQKALSPSGERAAGQFTRALCDKKESHNALESLFSRDFKRKTGAHFFASRSKATSMIQPNLAPKSSLLLKGTGYFFTGGIAAIVDLSIFLLISTHLSSIFVASTISFSVASVVNYWLSGNFVFKSKISLHGFFKFYGFALIGMMINSLITAGLSPRFGRFIGKVMGIGITFVFNFLMGNFVIFRK